MSKDEFLDPENWKPDLTKIAGLQGISRQAAAKKYQKHKDEYKITIEAK